jgi:serine/threonine protein kinase
MCFVSDNAQMDQLSCPFCNANARYGISPCAVCGALLEWALLPDGFKLDSPDGHDLELAGVLGRGGFGVTYLAQMFEKSGQKSGQQSGQQPGQNSVVNPGVSKRVAIKECFPEGLVRRDPHGFVIAKPGCQLEFDQIKNRFFREAKLLNQIKHPVSTQFLACWVANNTAYLMMEFIEGQTLEARIEQGSRLSEFEAVALLEPILDLLEVVHAQDLLHRDIKPANVMLTKDGVELIDFGSVIKFDAQRDTKISSKLLTPAYAPLELYGSQVRLGPSSDLYSLAASVYEAMTGVRVPSALDRSNGAVVQPLEAVLNSVSREFSKLIVRALELRIDDRFASAQEMRAALRGVPVFSNPVSSAPSFQGWSSGSSPVNTPAVPIIRGPQVPAVRRQPRLSRLPRFQVPRFQVPRFQVPRWVWMLTGVVALIFGVNRLMVFMNWRAGLEQTRLANQAFLEDQCVILDRMVHFFTCEVLEINDRQRKLELVIRTNSKTDFSADAFARKTLSPEYLDFVDELGGFALDLFDFPVIDVLVRQNGSDLQHSFKREISRDRLRREQSKPVTGLIQNLRAARAKIRVTMPSSETYLGLVGRREVTNSAFAQKHGLEIDSLSFGNNGSSADGVSMFVKLPGNDDILAKDILVFATNPEFRLGLRDMILRLHRALPGVPYLAVFVGKRNPDVSAAWSVSVATYNDDEFAQLAKASNSQLNDIWSFSSEYLPPIRAEGYPAESKAVNAWVIPVQTRGSKRAGQRSVLGVLQATEMYSIGRNKRGFQAVDQLEVGLFDAQGKPVRADVIDYGNAKLLLACCPNPDQDFKLEYNALDGFCCAGSTPYKDSVLAQRRFNPEALYEEPPNWLRVSLSQDRSGVMLECDPKFWALGFVVQVFSDLAVFTKSVEAPAKQTLSDCKLTVPFKQFAATNTLRLLRLGFSSASLIKSDTWGKGEWVQAQKISASAIETTPITHQDLIGLRRGESLEFGPSLKWVKK